jgi:hypothetical protein
MAAVILLANLHTSRHIISKVPPAFAFCSVTFETMHQGSNGIFFGRNEGNGMLPERETFEILPNEMNEIKV